MILPSPSKGTVWPKTLYMLPGPSKGTVRSKTLYLGQDCRVISDSFNIPFSSHIDFSTMYVASIFNVYLELKEKQ